MKIFTKCYWRTVLIRWFAVFDVLFAKRFKLITYSRSGRRTGVTKVNHESL